VVTNGTYAGGSQVDPHGVTNRVVVTKPLVLSSVNGPDVTLIDGGGAVQCLYLTNNTVMVGFTLTNGYAYSGGGISCESTNSVLSNCVLSGNSAYWDGGGAYGGTLNNCTLTGNSAYWGSGGGAYGGTLKNCVLTGNSAWDGGGIADSTLNNCVLTGNTAQEDGGGAYSDSSQPCMLNNCTLSGNSASDYYGSSGGGAWNCTLNNCIVYFNTATTWANYDNSYSTLNYCCTTPMPTNGVGNISADPQLASASHLSPYSPCIGAGSATYASGTDIDGEAWASPPSIGCDEYHAGAVTGPLTVSLTATFTNVAPGFPVGLTAFVAGRTDLSVWEFGDGDVEVNEPYTSHAWTAPGDYLVALWAFSDSYPEGVSATVTVRVLDHPVQYVALGSTNPVAPYLSWATAATNIQDAVNAFWGGRSLVLVTNGTYAPVTVNRPLTLQSVNGPGVTVINGGGTQECLYLTNNAVMVGFTLTNGGGAGVYCESSAVLSNCVLTGNSGGGAYGGTLNNCVLTGNSGGGAYNCALNHCVVSGNTGGGVGSSTLNNCVLTGNSAYYYGGGASGSTLNNCTLTGNSAIYGGGAVSCTLNNCIVYFNTATTWANYDNPSSTLNYCCTTPMPTNGVGNITADPQLASASHLSAWSPCIGAGSATYASGTDIDGEPWANPPSIGCDEYHAGAVTGPLTVSLTATYTNVATGFSVGLTALIAGRTDLSVWDFGDGSVEVNEPYTSHTWTAPGDYLVALWAFNDTYPEGVSATVTVRVLDHPVQYVALGSTNPVAPYLSWATAATNIQDAVDAAGAGGTVFVTNGTYAAGGRTTPATGDGVTNRAAVDKPLTVRSVNGPKVTVIEGQMTNGDIRCVYLANDAVLVGFTLTNGAADNGGGVYCESTSAVLTNCVLTGNWAYGYGQGGGAYRGTLNNCTLTGNSAWDGGGSDYSTLNNCTLTGNWGSGASDGTLNNCTLSGNFAAPDGWPGDGGGAYNCTLNNCTLTGNSANVNAPWGGGHGGGACGGTLNNCTLSGNSAVFGGGACGIPPIIGLGGGYYSYSTLNNCMLTSNSADYGGGGAEGSTLNNCTLTSNSASDDGGGSIYCTLNNCIVYFNSAPVDGNYDPSSTLNYCCTTPLPGGVGNITNAPLFLNYAGGNLRLQSNSPCINSGNNAYVVGSTDLDGNPRIVFGTVDIGAYEYQTPTSIISYAWLQQYGLPTDGSADHADLDGTGMNVYQDWIAGLNPTNALSVLKMLAPVKTNNPAGLVATWESVNTRTYYLQSSTNLAAQPAFSTIQSNIVGQAGTTSFTDTTATNAGPYFYRVGVSQ
jgi:parallel beta-helix repeat protein